jgi:hypothetical protein
MPRFLLGGAQRLDQTRMGVEPVHPLRELQHFELPCTCECEQLFEQRGCLQLAGAAAIAAGAVSCLLNADKHYGGAGCAHVH